MQPSSLTDPDCVTDFTERQLSQWLFGSDGPGMPPRPSRRLLGSILNIPVTAAARLCIPTILLAPNATAPGDVDALLVPQGDESHAVAFECKPVKVKGETFATGRPNRLSELKHGVRQANALYACGFERVYLVVAVAVDGRERPGNPFDRGLTLELRQLIQDRLQLSHLAPAVGLVVVEGVQWSPKSVHEAGGVGFQVMRDAAPRQQPLYLTEAIRRVFMLGA